MQKVAVIGLGRFGMVLARELAASGAQVIAIDRAANLVAEVKDEVDLAVKLDTTDEVALRSQEIDKCDYCVVAIGENFESALLTTVIAKKMGVKHVICRAQTAFHAEIFRQIGADEVIQPEIQAGSNLARRLANPYIDDFISLAEGYTLVELHAPGRFHGKSLRALELRAKYHVNLIAIKRPGGTGEEGEPAGELLSVPSADDVIQPGDVLIMAGSDESLANLPKE